MIHYVMAKKFIRRTQITLGREFNLWNERVIQPLAQNIKERMIQRTNRYLLFSYDSDHSLHAFTNRS